MLRIYEVSHIELLLLLYTYFMDLYNLFWVMQYIRLILLVHVYGSIPRVGVLYLLIKYLNSYSRVLLLLGNLRIKNMSKRVMNNIYHNYLHILY